MCSIPSLSGNGGKKKTWSKLLFTFGIFFFNTTPYVHLVLNIVALKKDIETAVAVVVVVVVVVADDDQLERITDYFRAQVTSLEIFPSQQVAFSKCLTSNQSS